VILIKKQPKVFVSCFNCGVKTKTRDRRLLNFCSKECKLEAQIKSGGILIGDHPIRMYAKQEFLGEIIEE